MKEVTESEINISKNNLSQNLDQSINANDNSASKSNSDNSQVSVNNKIA